MSVGLLGFYFGVWNLVTFFAKIKYWKKNVNRHNGRSSKCTKIGHPKTIFYDKKYLNLFKIEFQLK